MGKSPARWLKSVLLGKKLSKAGASKGKERPLNETKVLVTAKVEEPDAESDPSMIPTSISNPADRTDYVAEADDIEDAKSSDNEPSDLQISMPSNALSDAEKVQEEKAAVAVQAAFRGYLARRAFWALKGIIRLQALIRGHLVRRQAVATLCCTMGIVKLQAVVRARQVRYSEDGVEVRRKCRQPLTVNRVADPVGTTYLGIRTLTSNAFVLKILAPSPKVMPLLLRYDSADPNSASNWLECWSASHFWKPITQRLKVPSKKSQKKLGIVQTADAEAGRPKKNVRKIPSASLENPSGQTPVEFEKPKRSFRKVPSQLVDTVVENPQIELEKIKRNLRKVHNPVVENSIQPQPQPQTQPESEIEKPKLTVDKTSQPSLPIHGDVEQTASNVDDKIEKDSPVEEAKQPEINVPGQEMTELSEALPVDQAKPVDEVEPASAEAKPSLENETKDESTSATRTKGNSTGKENQKSSKKASVAAKKESSESNGQQSGPALPSYMQATQSAKAKLRLQGSPKSAGQDEAVEKNNVSRRHSLPTSGNGRITASHSPRTQRATNSGGKVGNKSDKSLLSSRDSNGKGNQVEWKR